MSSPQNSIVVTAEDGHVLRPITSQNWQVFRDTAAPGSGSYFAMDKDGVKEPLAGTTVLTSQLFANALFVDAVYGNDTLAAPHSLMDNANNALVHKYQTVAAAMADAEDGDTVVVYPGTYNENVNLFKDGVTYYFYSGAVTTCYWHNDVAEAECKVFGDGTFFSGPVFTASANSLIQIKDGFFSIEGDELFNNNLDVLGPTYVVEIGSAFVTNELNPYLIVKARNIVSEDHTCVAMYACGVNSYLSVTCDTMRHYTNSQSNEIIVSLGGGGIAPNFQGKAYIKFKRMINSPNYGVLGGSVMEISNRNTGERASINIEGDIYDISLQTGATRFLIDYTFNENTDFIYKGNVYSPNHSFLRVSDSSTTSATFRHEGIVTVGSDAHLISKNILVTLSASGLAGHCTIYLDGIYRSNAATEAILLNAAGTQNPTLFLDGSLYVVDATATGAGINRISPNVGIYFGNFKIVTNGGDSINFAAPGNYAVIHSLAKNFPAVNATNAIVGSIDYTSLGVI